MQNNMIRAHLTLFKLSFDQGSKMISKVKILTEIYITIDALYHEQCSFTFVFTIFDVFFKNYLKINKC